MASQRLDIFSFNVIVFEKEPPRVAGSVSSLITLYHKNSRFSKAGDCKWIILCKASINLTAW